MCDGCHKKLSCFTLLWQNGLGTIQVAEMLIQFPTNWSAIHYFVLRKNQFSSVSNHHLAYGTHSVFACSSVATFDLPISWKNKHLLRIRWKKKVFIARVVLPFVLYFLHILFFSSEHDHTATIPDGSCYILSPNVAWLLLCGLLPESSSKAHTPIKECSWKAEKSQR